MRHGFSGTGCLQVFAFPREAQQWYPDGMGGPRSPCTRRRKCGGGRIIIKLAGWDSPRLGYRTAQSLIRRPGDTVPLLREEASTHKGMCAGRSISGRIAFDGVVDRQRFCLRSRDWGLRLGFRALVGCTPVERCLCLSELHSAPQCAFMLSSTLRCPTHARHGALVSITAVVRTRAELALHRPSAQSRRAQAMAPT